jgi:hypothetical protein
MLVEHDLARHCACIVVSRLSRNARQFWPPDLADAYGSEVFRSADRVRDICEVTFVFFHLQDR